MPLAAGTRLGPYEIVAPLGAGGMGEVFHARDTRLGRDVAIKALPATFAQDAERLARFEREAKLLASLNHPNVAGIHGVEEVGGTRYLVLEFVDGETLEATLKRGPLPLAEVLDVGGQVAAGVEAAHESGVVHRDLKPGNIMLTASGAVKVLDFGLAKGGVARAASSSDDQLSASPTMTYAATQAGMMLGTAAFMSPEQARGKPVDRRTDIWSFGCVLYEMLANRRAFEGETVSDLVARILEREPDWSALPSSTPPRLVALIRRCLVKDAKQRVRDIGDVRLELEAIAAGDSGAAVVAMAPTPAGNVWRTALIAGVFLAAGAAIAWLAGQRGAHEAPATLSLLAPPGVTFGRKCTDVVLSPDGRKVAFVASDSTSGTRLWLRDLSIDNARPLSGTGDAELPFWAPDGHAIAYFAGGKLMCVDVVSGAVHTLADAPLPRGGAWGRGVILFQPRSMGPLWKIPETGGEAMLATKVDSASGDRGHRFPQFLPDGKHFVLTTLGTGDNQAAVGEIGKLDVRHLFRISAGGGVCFGAPDWLIFDRGAAVRAQRLDLVTLRLSGPPLDLPGPQLVSPYSNGSPIVQTSRVGSMIQRSGEGLPMRLSVVDREGRPLGNPPCPEGVFTFGNISLDGSRLAIAYASTDGAKNQIWAGALPSGALQPQTFDGYAGGPAISPDGKQATFVAGESDAELWTVTIGDPGSARRITKLPARFSTILGYAPDGRGVLLRVQGTDTRQDLAFMAFADTSHVQSLLATRFNEPRGAISPDGKWLAYISDESARYECRVRPFGTSGGAVIVVSHGAWSEPNAAVLMGQPMWRRDGRELAYIGPDGHSVMSVAVTPGNPPAFGEPRLLFRYPSAVADIAMSPGLDRFVLSIIREDEGRSAATILLNWPRLLERKR